MPLRMQTPQMIPNTIAGKNMNVITTLANSVVAISTNINTGVGITSRCPYRASAGMGTYQALTKLLPVHTELSSSRPTVWCALNFKPSHNHNLNCTITYMYNNFENMLTAQHQTTGEGHSPSEDTTTAANLLLPISTIIRQRTISTIGLF